MSRQTSLMDYISKKAKNNKPAPQKRVKHNSSREASEETVRLPDDDEPEVKMEVFEKRVMLVCHAFTIISPISVLHFPRIISKLQRLEQNYGKEEAINFIEGNLRFHKIQNVRNLQSINDDDFWCLTLPKLIQILLSELPKMNSPHQRLLANSQEIISLSRLEILVMLASMLLGIMPKQPHEECVSFGELMTLRVNQLSPARAAARLQKLKCLIAYFNIMVKHESIYDEIVKIQRTSNRDQSYLEVYNMDREVPLLSVRFELLEDAAIEDYCGKAIMIDFANKKLGGGVLKNGCVQEEILFAIFPELIVTKLICQELEENEAVIIYSARRFAKYSGYSDSFKFEGQWPLQSSSIVEDSVMVAIDALDFSKYPTENFQYSKKGVRRQINKAFAGINGAYLGAHELMPVCTGKWGCGAFKGNEDMKFLIQWLAVSEASRQMIYITDSREKLEEYKLLTQQLARHTTLDLLCLLDEYYRARTRANSKPLPLLQYIKNQA